jgi:Tol biopolymer transport system component
VAGSTAARAGGHTFPGLNGSIVYTKPFVDSRIWRVDPDGTDDTPLTPATTAGDNGPEWSPDGTRIAFSRCLAPGGCIARIWVMNADGSGARSISIGSDGNSNYSDSEPVWSPDGERLAYIARHHYAELLVVNADGRGLRKLTGGEAQQVTRLDRHVFSPDGHTIAFDREKIGEGIDVFAIAPNGKGLSNLTETGTSYGPAWSPDGTKIAYHDGIDIWTMSADGTNQTNVTQLTGPGFASNPLFTPDGAGIVYTEIDPTGNPFALTEVFHVDLGSGTKTNLTNTPMVQETAWTFSPEGDMLAGRNNTTGVWYVMDADGSGVTPLVEGAPADWQPLCTINGTAAGEAITGTAARDIICAGGGNDVIRGSGGNDIVFGGGGNDRLFAADGNDILSGQAGNDTIVPGAGNDSVSGGSGLDTVSFTDATAAIVASLAGGTASGAGSDMLSTVENLTGSAWADVLTGTSGANTLSGGNGNDRLKGGGGDDRLFGGNGRDTLLGEGGNDRLHGGPQRDVCHQGPGRGARIACEA